MYVCVVCTVNIGYVSVEFWKKLIPKWKLSETPSQNLSTDNIFNSEVKIPFSKKIGECTYIFDRKYIYFRENIY
jgi:hypothetical protein